jgi:hypothetical protein
MKIFNVDEDVPCPAGFGELALAAIQTARDLTEQLRRDNPHWAGFLFLVPGCKRRSAHVLTTKQINEYINGQKNKGGLRDRYDIPVENITTHNFRHTRATNAWYGGLQVHEVSYDLGHISSDIAVRHYIVGHEESRRRLQTLMAHGALKGALEDMVGGQEMTRTRLSSRHVEILKRQGRYMSAHRYGACADNSSGPCTRTIPCYLGVGVEDEGCEYHVLTPDALPALEEDKEVAEANIATYGPDPACRNFVAQQQNLLVVIKRKIALTEELQQRVDSCDGSGTCGCKANKTGGG